MIFLIINLNLNKELFPKEIFVTKIYRVKMSGFGPGGKYMFGDDFADAENSKMMYRDMDYEDFEDEDDDYYDEELYGDEMTPTSS